MATAGFPNLLAYWVQHFNSINSILNSSIGIPSPPLASFVVMLPKAHLTSHSRVSVSRWVTTTSWLSRSLRPFLYSSSFSCHLFLISSASVRSLTVSVFYHAHPCLCSLGISNFLKRSLVFPILLFSCFLLCSLKKAFLSPLAILWNSAFSSVYLSLSLLPFTPLLSSTIVKPPHDNHFNFLHVFFFEMVSVTASYTMYESLSVVPQVLCWQDLIPWIFYSSPPLHSLKVKVTQSLMILAI